jgi:hypothetical protein
MGKNAAPGMSLAAQMREGRAKVRRALRLEIEREKESISQAEKELAARKDALREKELMLNGKAILERGQAANVE